MTPHLLHRAGATGAFGVALVLGGCVAPLGAMLQTAPSAATAMAGAPAGTAGCQQPSAASTVGGLGAILGGGQGLAGLADALGGAQRSATAAPCLPANADAVPGAPTAPRHPTGEPQAADPDLVRATQAQLIRLGYLHGGADGVMGPMTSTAIARFETASGLPVDGAPSAVLLTRLQASSS